MDAIASQITSLTIVYSIVYSDADQRKHQSSASLAFVRGIHRGPVNSPHKWPVTRKMFPFDDVIMFSTITRCTTDAVAVFTRYMRHSCTHICLIYERRCTWTMAEFVCCVHTRFYYGCRHRWIIVRPVKMGWNYLSILKLQQLHHWGLEMCPRWVGLLSISSMEKGIQVSCKCICTPYFCQ